jgi:PAT family beta-lactamase induction signal transducer AmpG
VLTDRFGPARGAGAAGPLPWQGSTLPPALQARWVDLVALLLGMAFTLPLAAWAARRARFETLLAGLRDYFSQPGAAAILAADRALQAGRRLCRLAADALPAEGHGLQLGRGRRGQQGAGPVADDRRRAAGGALMLRLGLWRSLLLFGVLQMASNLGFWWLAQGGKGQLGAVLLPAFDWGFVKLAAGHAGGRRRC